VSEAIQLMFGIKVQRLNCAFSFAFNWIASRSLAMTKRDSAPTKNLPLVKGGGSIFKASAKLKR
jgi:hypothetical protein